MDNNTKKKVTITEVTKRFTGEVERLVNKGLAANYKEIAEKINWTEASISSVRKQRINIPNKYVKTFEEVYKIPILDIPNDDIQNRLLRIEANLEVFQVAIASLKVKKTGDFEQRFFELQQLIEEAVIRRRSKLDSSS